MPAPPPVNRNDPCPCGSGKKYKKCCLALAAAPADAPRTDPRPLVQQGIAHLNAGRPRDAEALFRRALEASPRLAWALFGLGKVCAQTGRRDEALRLFEQAIAAEAGRAEFHVSLADALISAGRPDDAAASARRAIDLEPSSAPAWRMLANCHARANRVEEALAACRRAVDLDPGYSNAAIVLAGLEARAGDLDAARRRLEAVIEAETDVEYLHRAWRELANVLDRLGAHEEAFAACAKGAALRARTPLARGLERGVWSRRIASCREGFTRDLLARLGARRFDDGGWAPAFLVGFPRSGTTMTEQVLAAHPRVLTTDEAPLVNALRREIEGDARLRGDLPARLAALDEARILALRALYRREAEQAVGALPGGSVFLDKLPLNVVHLGLLNAVFPEAKVIVALRDPRDVCVSCFFQAFELNTAMVNFLSWEGTAAFYAEVMGLWLLLRERITLPWIEIRYEDTVADLEAQARRLLAHLGLDWDPGVLRFHEAARGRFLSTPSFAAVAEPVHARAVARWRRYPQAIHTVERTLRPFIEAFGYGSALGEGAA